MAQPASNRQKDNRTSLPAHGREPGLTKFILDPVKGFQSLLRLRRPDAIKTVLGDPEFTATLDGLARKASQSTAAAFSLSRIALRPEFSTAATAAISAAAEWPDPSKFAAAHRRVAADALERVRPTWALAWLARGFLSALPYADLRRFFAARLLLASGGLVGAIQNVTALLSTQERRGKRSQRDLLTLLQGLRTCARSAAAHPSAGAAALAAFVGALIPRQSENGDPEIKRQLVELLQEAATSDRGLILEEPFLALAATLDPNAANKFRADAAKLLPGTIPSPDPPPVPRQADLMKEAAWSEADEALGRALQDMGLLARSFEQLESVVQVEAADGVRRAKGASKLVLQWVRQAARERNVAILSKVGEKVPFDPALHDLDGDVSPGIVSALSNRPSFAAAAHNRWYSSAARSSWTSGVVKRIPVNSGKGEGNEPTRCSAPFGVDWLYRLRYRAVKSGHGA